MPNLVETDILIMHLHHQSISFSWRYYNCEPYSAPGGGGSQGNGGAGGGGAGGVVHVTGHTLVAGTYTIIKRQMQPLRWSEPQ